MPVSVYRSNLPLVTWQQHSTQTMGERTDSGLVLGLAYWISPFFEDQEKSRAQAYLGEAVAWLTCLLRIRRTRA
jgi:hypothetical protein